MADVTDGRHGDYHEDAARIGKRQRTDQDMPNPHVQESGGEISLGIEETNKLRISLGLKPLNMEAPRKQSAPDMKRQEEEAKKKEQEKLAAEMRERIAAHKSARQQQSFLQVRSLGEPDDDDDTASWVERNRRAVAAKKEQEQRQQQQGQRQQGRGSRGEDADEDDEQQHGYGGKDLAGLKVRHGLGDLDGGNEVVLTLADRGILDEKGNLVEEGDDELENVRVAEERKRKKAREAAAPKAKPLWEEDGKRRGILDKYDMEDDEVLQLGDLEADQAARREETRRRLEAAGKKLDTATAGPASVSSDYYTSVDMAAMKAPGDKKKRRKERKIRTTATALGEDEDGNTDDLVAQLEAQAAGEGADLGTRSERESARQRAAAAERAEALEKRARFEAALEKSNWASQALKPLEKTAAKGSQQGSRAAGTSAAPQPQQAPEEQEEEEEELGDEADRELWMSLERARRVAQAQVKKEEGEEDKAEVKPVGLEASLASIASAAARKREEEEKEIKKEILAGSTGLVFNDTMDFVSNINTKRDEQEVPPPPPPLPGGATPAAAAAAAGPAARQDAEDDEEGYMGVNAKDDGDDGARRKRKGTQGGWVRAKEEEAEDVEMEDAQEEAPKPTRRHRQREQEADEGPSKEEDETEGVTVQAKVGKGLASVLGLLKDKGTLQEKQYWAGRNSDKSKVALQGLHDVYTGGSSEDRVARSVETALTRKDEFGRVLTPKERFRELCYQFHGKGPSKNKIEKKLHQAKQELAIRKLASEQAEEADKRLKVQEKTSLPFIVLSGKGYKETLAAASAVKGMPPPPNKPPQSKNKAGQQGSKGAGGGGGGGAGSAGTSLGGILGGGLTPLTGDRKVEAMLGLKKAS